MNQLNKELNALARTTESANNEFKKKEAFNRLANSIRSNSIKTFFKEVMKKNVGAFLAPLCLVVFYLFKSKWELESQSASLKFLGELLYPNALGFVYAFFLLIISILVVFNHFVRKKSLLVLSQKAAYFFASFSMPLVGVIVPLLVVSFFHFNFELIVLSTLFLLYNLYSMYTLWSLANFNITVSKSSRDSRLHAFSLVFILIVSFLLFLYLVNFWDLG